jgi:uncharacterized cupredoxin-like copper-binding protein
MKKTAFLLTSVLISLALVCSARSEAQNGEVDQQFVWDFGKVQEKTTSLHEFIFKNQGTKRLFIKEITTSCGCTVSSVKKKDLAPGEETAITVKFDSKGYNGATKQFIYVHTDDPANPVVRFVIKADVEKKK